MNQVPVDSRLFSLVRPRPGPAPRTSVVLPFRQVEQFPPLQIHQRLIDQCLALPGVLVRESRMASPAVLALYLADEACAGPPEAFIDQHEFCHLHPLPEGAIHLALPAQLLDLAVALGWAERHPIGALGILTTLALVYAPRNAAELEVVRGLVNYALRFARGDAHEELAITQVA